MPGPESVFAAHAHRHGAVWLDGGRTSGWSILAFDPVEVITQAEDWPEKARALQQERLASDVPFQSGVIGYIGYSAGSAVTPIPPEPPTPEPPVWLGRYEGAMCFEHATGRWHLAGNLAGRADLLNVPSLAEPPLDQPKRPWRTVPQSAYERAVERVLAWIAAGDCYQINLSRAMRVDGVQDPWRTYRQLRQVSAPGFGAYMRLNDDTAILSNSPELFLEAEGRALRTLPIKGTRPRGRTPAEDAALAHELLHAEKDRAELTMIVDLCRNDLGRVAEVGSVHPLPRVVLPHANVHHAEQEVRATLREGLDAWDAVAAAFPPGSVTGAPKIRACQRIRELEPTGRGVYCGAIGFSSDAGRARWNVAIRTAVWHRKTVRYHVGGGVVADSDPTAEWEETIDKGTALAQTLVGVPRPESS